MSAPVTNPPANPTNGNGNGGNNQASGSQNSQVSNTNQQSSTSRLIIPPSAPAGLVIITQPPETATSYYKIAPSNTITFGWNFTYVLATPTHLTVSAIADNGNTYPVGPTDGIIPGTATEVTWDIYSYQQANPNTPLAQATYTLSIWDDRGSTAIRQAGWLTPNNNLRFALYNPSSYTPLASGWSCVECSGTWARYTAHPAFAGIVATFIIMFLSGFSLFRRRWN